MIISMLLIFLMFQSLGPVVGEGSRLVLGGVGRGEGGLYRCGASNGVEEEGERVSADIRLTVHCEYRVIIALVQVQFQSRKLSSWKSLSCPYCRPRPAYQ